MLSVHRPKLAEDFSAWTETAQLQLIDDMHRLVHRPADDELNHRPGSIRLLTRPDELSPSHETSLRYRAHSDACSAPSIRRRPTRLSSHWITAGHSREASPASRLTKTTANGAGSVASESRFRSPEVTFAQVRTFL